MFFKLGLPLRDFIHLFDMAGRFRNRHTTYSLKPHPDADKLWDHSFDSPIFRQRIRDELNLYLSSGEL